MANDLARPIRRASLARLKADPDLIAIIPAASLYPQTTPAQVAWPFGKIGVISSFPIRAGCVDGCTGIFAVHAFTKERLDGGAVVETAEDHASRAGAAVAAALDRQFLDLDGGHRVKVKWTGSRVMQDGDEAGAYHGVIDFEFRCLA
jgi:hypothetical protein